MDPCNRCNYLTISRRSKEHVIRKHFRFENWYSINPWQSYFFANIINPQELFYVVQNIPRCELGQIGWSYRSRFMYIIDRFNFDLGVYPYQGTTNKIMIVCNCVECPGCGIHAPTAIVTIYPWDEYYENYGRYWRVPDKRKPKLWRKICSAAAHLNAVLDYLLANWWWWWWLYLISVENEAC